jgi:hypothetical protein
MRTETAPGLDLTIYFSWLAQTWTYSKQIGYPWIRASPGLPLIKFDELYSRIGSS